jgi:hypothetical protein
VAGTEAEVRAKSGSDALRQKTMGKAGLRAGITKAAKKWDKRRFPKMRERNVTKREGAQRSLRSAKVVAKAQSSENVVLEVRYSGKKGTTSEGVLKESIIKKRKI